MSWAPFSILTKVRPASDIKALPSHTTVKATTGRKEQFKTVAHPAAHGLCKPERDAVPSLHPAGPQDQNEVRRWL
jgi:hypothetical protein